jgi:hypothetical protein
MAGNIFRNSSKSLLMFMELKLIYGSFFQIYGWVPDPYTTNDELPAKMPQYVKDLIKSGQRPPSVWMSCEGISPADKEYIGELQYFPYPVRDLFACFLHLAPH